MKVFVLAGFWLVVFIATHLPRLPRAVNRVSDKTWHCLAFAILATLLSWVLHGRIKGTVRHTLCVIGVIAVYGAIDELLQIPVGRHCDLRDWFADLTGAAIGVSLFQFGRFLKRRYYVPQESADRG